MSFDTARHECLGYILPTWRPPLATTATTTGGAADSRLFAQPTDSGTSGGGGCATRIVLPIKSQLLDVDGGDSLRCKFEDVQPTLLLFLQKLQCIAVSDTTRPSRSTVMAKRRLGPNLVELRHGPR